MDPDLSSVAAECRALWRGFRRWGLRFYLGAFVALAFLFVARAVRHDDALRVTAKGLASAAGMLAVACGVISSSYAVRQRRAARKAGLDPRAMR